MNFKKIHKQLQRPLVRGLILIPPLILILIIVIIAYVNLFTLIILDEHIKILSISLIGIIIYFNIGLFIILYSDFKKISEKYKNE